MFLLSELFKRMSIAPVSSQENQKKESINKENMEKTFLDDINLESEDGAAARVTVTVYVCEEPSSAVTTTAIAFATPGDSAIAADGTPERVVCEFTVNDAWLSPGTTVSVIEVTV